MPATSGPASGRGSNLWWVCLLAVGFAGYYALLVFCDLTRPEPAGLTFVIHDDALVVSAVRGHSPAERARLKEGDRIRAVDGKPVRGRLDWLLIETNLTAGSPMVLDIDRGGAHATLSLTLASA